MQFTADWPIGRILFHWLQAFDRLPLLQLILRNMEMRLAPIFAAAASLFVLTAVSTANAQQSMGTTGQGMSNDGMQKPMMKKKMSKRQEMMMKKKKMMMMKQRNM